MSASHLRRKAASLVNFRRADSANAPPPCFFAAPGTPSSFFPSGYEGMARQGALPSSVQDPHLLAEMRKRLPARHPNISQCPGSFAAVFFRFAHSRKRNACAGPRFPGAVSIGGFPIRGCREPPPGLPSLSDGLSGKKLRASLNGCTVSQLLAGGSYWPPGGAPAPPECVGGAFVSRPRAPHPAPSSDAS